MNRARLRELGFELGARVEAGVSDEGAWFATAPDGAPVVLGAGPAPLGCIRRAHAHGR